MDSESQMMVFDPPENVNDLVLHPVGLCESGEGLPYAPINWPNHGDNWLWKVGTRVNSTGYMQDRYLYPPNRLQKKSQAKYVFRSKVAVRKYIMEEFPGTDVDAFFASFSWLIPAKSHLSSPKDESHETTGSKIHPKKDIPVRSESELKTETRNCKIENEDCSVLQARSYQLPVMDCDICCSESSFCRDCCCILCCKPIDDSYGGYTFIRCQARSSENSDFVCGHVAHLDCAVRSCTAGTTGGSSGLDAEYYCRRCDSRRDLIPHIEKLFQTCKSLDSKDDIEMILNLGACILDGSQKERAKSLMDRINSSLEKLKDGTFLGKILKVEDKISEVSAGCTRRDESNGMQKKSRRRSTFTSEPHNRIAKLEDKIEKVLDELKNSEDDEYKLVEGKLNPQKERLLDLYQQLVTERFNLISEISST